MEKSSRTYDRPFCFMLAFLPAKARFLKFLLKNQLLLGWVQGAPFHMTWHFSLAVSVSQYTFFVLCVQCFSNDTQWDVSFFTWCPVCLLYTNGPLLPGFVKFSMTVLKISAVLLAF